MIGYPCGQDEAILPAGDYAPCPARKTCSLSHVMCSIYDQYGLILASFFACFRTSTPSRSINMKENQLGQYVAILTSGLVNKPYLQRELCFELRIQIPSYTLIFLKPFSFSFQGLGLFANKDMEAVSCVFFTLPGMAGISLCSASHFKI